MTTARPDAAARAVLLLRLCLRSAQGAVGPGGLGWGSEKKGGVDPRLIKIDQAEAAHP